MFFPGQSTTEPEELEKYFLTMDMPPVSIEYATTYLQCQIHMDAVILWEKH